MEYRFNKEEHLHELMVNGEWKALTGVTSLIDKTVAKPALVPWAAGETVNYIREHCERINKLSVDQEYLVRESDLEEAKIAHRKIKEKAGTWGTRLHTAIESFAKDGKWCEDKELQAPFHDFVEWFQKDKVEVQESEKHVWSKDKFIGGIVDLVVKIDGKIFLADIKTAKGIYPTNFIQMGAYQLCLEEMDGLKVEGHIVINLPKKGGIKVKTSYATEENKKAFLNILELYRTLENLKVICE